MYVALDLGLKHVGIAISKTHIIATPYKNLTIKNDLFKDILKELKILDEKYQIKKIYIGLPIHMDGNESELSKLFRKIAKKLKREFPKIIFQLVDERLSSKNSSKQKKYGERNDSIVAAEILMSQLK